jgi:hypothetical protein
MILFSDLLSGAMSSVAVALLLLGLIMLAAARHFRPAPIVPGRSLGGSPLKRIELMPEEDAAVEVAEAGLSPKHCGRLFLTRHRLIFLPGSEFISIFGTKPKAIELSAITDVIEVDHHWLVRALFRLGRLRVVTQEGSTDFWPLLRGDPSKLTATVRDALVAQGWQPKRS